MIPEIVATVAGVGAVAGWVFAYRARGESRAALAAANEAADRARLEAARADAAEARANALASDAAAAAVELKATRAEVSVVRSVLTRERREKAALLADLATRGVPVGPVLVDDAIDRLYPHENDQGRGPGADGDANGTDRSVSDDAPTDPGKPTKTRGQS
jgi:hypothetical protein